MENFWSKKVGIWYFGSFNIQTGIDGKDIFVSNKKFDIKYSKGNITIYYENIEKKEYTLKLIDVSGRVQDKTNFKIKDDKGVLSFNKNLKREFTL